MKHSITSQKFHKQITNNVEAVDRVFYEKGWLSKDAEILDLLKDGIEQFRIKAADRILRDNPDKIYLNNCFKCGKLARTPQAKQCGYCGHNWHKQVVATFQIASAFHVTGRQFFIIGEILSGAIKTGMKADLTILGLAIKPLITAIEFDLHREEDISWEDIGLGLSEISDEDQEFLKSNCPFIPPILIED